MGNYTVVTTKSAGQAVSSSEWNSQVGQNINLALFRQLAETVLSGSAASIDFTSIPGTFRHLRLVVYGRGDSGASSNVVLRFNADTAANYDYQYLQGSAASATAAENFGGTYIVAGSLPGTTASANSFGAITVDIPHYANSANHKIVLVENAYKTGTSSGNMARASFLGAWRATSAITQVTLQLVSGNLVSGTVATLYGLPA